MTLTSVREGDIIRADSQHYQVLAVEKGAVVVRGIGRAGIRTVKARAVEAHWKRTKR